MKRCFAALLVAILLVGVLLPAGAMAATQYATVVGGWLRLRSYASFNASTINSYDTGTQVKVLSVTGNWYNVETPDGQRGYMYGDYLRLGSTPVPPSPSGDSNAIVVSSNGYGVRLRSGPGTGYRILGKYAVGTRAYIVESGSYWSRIQIGGKTGYMMNQFLSRDGYVPPVYDGDATIWSANGKGVRLRTGPGTGYGKIGVYSVGTQVRILEKGYIWDKVQIGSRVGYMMNEFLIYNDYYEVTGVSINNYNPVVGNVLAVQTLTPATATVTYQWYVGGVAKAGETRASYTVVADDVDKVIQLVVAGTGSYSGTATSTATSKVAGSGAITDAVLNNMSPVVGDTLGVTALTPSYATVSYKWVIGGTKTVTTSTYYVISDDLGKSIELTLTGTGNFTGSKTITTGAVTSTGTITDVTITNTTNAGKDPDTGDTIRAAAVPSTANATYKWTVSGVTDTFTGATLVVKSDWHGKTITVTATGTGAYASNTYSKSVVIGTPSLNATGLVFDDVQDGYAQPAAKFLTINNTGKAKAHVTAVTVSPANFTISPTAGTVAAESTNSTTWAVQPKTGLAIGSYTSDITFTYDGQTLTTSASIDVTAKAPSLTATPTSIDFGEPWEGNTPNAITITVKNVGLATTGTLTAAMATTTDVYQVGSLSVTTIPALGSATLTITPKKSEKGDHANALVITDGTTTLTVPVKYNVRVKPTVRGSDLTTTIAQGSTTPQDLTLTVSPDAEATQIQATFTPTGKTAAGDFTLQKGNATIAAGATDTSWKLVPKAGLAPERYTGIVTFSYYGVTASASPVCNVVITVTAATTYSVSGTVTSQVTGNAPISGASVQLFNSDGSRAGNAVLTAADGKYTILGVASGSGYTIEVTHASYASGTIAGFNVTNGNVLDKNAQLAPKPVTLSAPLTALRGSVSAQPTYTVSGTVTSAGESSVVIQGAVVQLKNSNDENVGVAATTDESGAYSIASVVSGTGYKLSVSCDGYVGVTTDGFDVADAARTVNFTLAAEAGNEGASDDDDNSDVTTYTVSGTVASAGESSAAIPGATVQLKNGNGENVGEAVATNESGAYSIANVANGTGYKLAVSGNGFTATETEAFNVADANATVNVALEAVTGGASAPEEEDDDPIAATYTVTYNANNGSAETMTSGTATQGVAFQLPACTFTAPVNHTFDGWAIGSADGAKPGETYTFTADTTVYATWRENQAATYTITFNANNGSGETTSGTATEGMDFQLPACAFTAPENQEFDGWEINGSRIAAGENCRFTAHTTVTALWKNRLPVACLVTYDVNGGTNAETMQPGTVTVGASTLLPACAFTAPSGQQFKEWAIGSFDSATRVQPGEGYTFTADTTVYAIWESIPLASYTITYNANGGSGTTPSGTATQNTPFMLAQCGFAAPSDGQQFLNWAIGSPTGTPVSAGGSHTFEGDETVYAVWSAAQTGGAGVQ